MATTFFRIIKFGLQNFSRNGLLSATTVAILVLALLVFNGLITFGIISNSAIASLQDKIDISVYFTASANEDSMLSLQRALESLTEVKSVEYISQDKALTIFKDRHKGDDTISAALNELQINPLLASLNIKAKSASNYPTIAEYLESEKLAGVVDKVTYGENRTAIDRLARIIDTLQNTGFAATFFLAAMAILVTFNTIRLAIYSNREELGIMRLVGASNKFINGPYIVAGVIYGFLGGVISLAIAAPIVVMASPYVSVFIPELSLSAYLLSHLPQLVFYNLAFGIGLGSISAAVAARRYLKL
ncbi:MAG: permease-like cell division protein FtsX [bacterium]|nr:permease-like cell division protein FtsX [bacterium]